MFQLPPWGIEGAVFYSHISFIYSHLSICSAVIFVCKNIYLDCAPNTYKIPNLLPAFNENACTSF